MLDFRENPTFAAFPAALCSVFSLRRYVTALLFLNRRIHSFRICLSAYWGQKRKLQFPFLRIIVSAHENLGELSPAVFRDWRATPPFKRFRVLCGVFSLFLLVATRRRTAGGALCLPPSPRVLVAPLPQKSHTASRVAIFGDPVIF